MLVHLGVMQGEFHWHEHDEQDEYLFAVGGQLHIELDGRDPAVLRSRDAFCVPAGLHHPPVAPVRTAVLMIERAGDVSTTD